MSKQLQLVSKKALGLFKDLKVTQVTLRTLWERTPSRGCQCFLNISWRPNQGSSTSVTYVVLKFPQFSPRSSSTNLVTSLHSSPTTSYIDICLIETWSGQALWGKGIHRIVLRRQNQELGPTGSPETRGLLIFPLCLQTLHPCCSLHQPPIPLPHHLHPPPTQQMPFIQQLILNSEGETFGSTSIGIFTKLPKLTLKYILQKRFSHLALQRHAHCSSV